MSVLIKDMEKPKTCYAVIDGESEYCPFVNTDDDCVLLLKKGTCEGTWEEQYSKCPLVEVPQPCEDAVSREQVLKLFSTHDGKHLYEAIQMLPSVTLKPDHSGDTTEMVEYDDCVSRQAVIDTARKIEFIFEGEYDTRTPYGVIFDVQDAVSKLPSVTPKRKMGKWIEYDSDEDKYDVIKCPCCKHTFTVDAYHWTDIGFVKDDFKFCPNCGADTRGNTDDVN